MLEGNFWAIKNVRLTLIAPLIVATASVSFAPRAEAAGTVAGSTIANTATASYTDSGGNAQTATSNTANLRVDELLDVAVTSADPGDIPTLPSGVNQVASFTVTNTGNGSEAYSLAVTTALGGDQFDPTTTSIVLDTNGNGVYDLKGLSNLFGTDLKYDVGKGVDLGFSGSLRQNPEGSSFSWSGGPTVGIAAMKNGYVSIGYNVTGFSDRDYDASRYTRSGPFVTLRMKFDQGLLSGLGLGR